MQAPLCRICGARHWSGDPHVEVVTPVTKAVTKATAVTPPVTKRAGVTAPVTHNVTKPVTDVTPTVTTVRSEASDRDLLTRLFAAGVLRESLEELAAGRAKVWPNGASPAERQRKSRQRRQSASAARP